MNKDCAINIIEGVSGFTDEDTPVGEAWSFILQQMAMLEGALMKIAEGRGYIADYSTIRMNGTRPLVPKVFNARDMQEIAQECLILTTPTIPGA